MPASFLHFCSVEIDRLIEILSAITSLWSIWLNTRRKTAGWPIGLVSVTLASWVYYRSGLLAECALQAFYFASGFYGWWKWAASSQLSEDQSVEILRLRMSELIFGILAALLGSGLIWMTLQQFPGASRPVPDALLTAFSILAQIWLARRKIENWLLWIIINTGSVLLYLQRELWFFALLYLALLYLAVRAYADWKKILRSC